VGELEQQIVTLSTQLVSGSQKQSVAREKLEGALAAAIREKDLAATQISTL
jgi:hypothetical protein